MRIIVYEHLSSGGYAGQSIPLCVLSEGFGMLRSIVSDLKSAGHEVTVLLDDRISKLNPPMDADCFVPILYSQEPEKFLASVAKINDAVYIIAPETGKILQSLVEIVEQTGKNSLNCESKSIKNVADKTILYNFLKRNDLPTPRTLLFKVSSSLGDFKETIHGKLNYPVVFKPASGVSCSGLSFVKTEDEVCKAIDKIRSETPNSHFIVQEFIEGEAVSVSLLCSKNKAFAISLNKQIVKIVPPSYVSSYEGGALPYDHPLKEEAIMVSKKVVELFSGLRGYVGVDLVLTKDKAFVVDVNPRLTTSYVGLSLVSNFNVAQASINAVLKDQLPTQNESCGFVYFSKLETFKPTNSVFQKVAQMNEVISPPFPLHDNPKTCSLIAGQGASLKDAKLQLEKTKKHVFRTLNRGK